MGQDSHGIVAQERMEQDSHGLVALEHSARLLEKEICKEFVSCEVLDAVAGLEQFRDSILVAMDEPYNVATPLRLSGIVCESTVKARCGCNSASHMYGTVILDKLQGVLTESTQAYMCLQNIGMARAEILIYLRKCSEVVVAMLKHAESLCIIFKDQPRSITAKLTSAQKISASITCLHELTALPDDLKPVFEIMRQQVQSVQEFIRSAAQQIETAFARHWLLDETTHAFLMGRAPLRRILLKRIDALRGFNLARVIDGLAERVEILRTLKCTMACDELEQFYCTNLQGKGESSCAALLAPALACKSALWTADDRVCVGGA